ncbi:Dimethylaniline monooxygenase [N-oxide-forming] [Aphelenchoides fujianensis]|nr:Dimethylaniline monooxygenase [N-oxide-forming] [Aphelenchoides fujianensis]
MKRVAVVGGGPSGLTSARNALANGHEVVIFEKREVLGGRWNFSEDPNVVTVAESTNMKNSSVFAEFSDFPLPEGSSAVLSQKEAADYLLAYAQHFDLIERTRFRTEVTSIDRHPDYEQNGCWIVTSKREAEEKKEEFDLVLVCTGWNQRPWRPNPLRLESAFKGVVSHSTNFKSARSFHDKTVVLVGFGNAAAEIAVALGAVAKKVYISTRRLEWTTHLIEQNGRPFDRSYQTQGRHLARRLTPKLLRNLWWAQAEKRWENGGRVPEHRFFGHLPHVIFCTGVEFDFRLLEGGRLIAVSHNDFQAFLHMLHPEHTTLGLIGFVQPHLGCRWPLAELQARVFFAVQSGRIRLPSVFERRERAEFKRCCISLDFLLTRRHTH